MDYAQFIQNSGKLEARIQELADLVMKETLKK